MSSSVAKAPSSSPILLWAHSRRRILFASGAALTGLLVFHFTQDGASESTREASLAAVLARSGVAVETDTVLWLSERASWLGTPTLFLARTSDDAPRDLYYARVRIGGEAAVIDVSNVSNLTRSPGADEDHLTRAGTRWAAFSTHTEDGVVAVTTLDLDGEPASETEGWTRTQRLQGAITNWQETGRTQGFGTVRYQLLSPHQEVALEGDDEALHATIDTDSLRIAFASREVTEGADLIEVQAQESGMPGGVTWVVDTVRNLSFVGPAPIEWLENRVFRVQDTVQRARYAMLGSEDEASGAAEAIAATNNAPLTVEERQLLDASAAEIGFPPAPMTSIFPTPAAGEGEWVPVVNDPFVNAYPNAPPAFAQSFIRPDRERPYVNVFVTLWDPRQVQLRTMPGTREPESATGQRGTGQIPRDEMTSRMLVGAFDGGFQAMHGEFGMMADDRVYLPPKPWAATVAIMDDGRIGMGSWPAPNWRGAYYDENLANAQIPESMVDMRQNLTSVVEGGVYNPWGRWWWGAAPPGATEQTLTHRSGMCITEEGFAAFFWGGGLGPEALGQAMISARCARSMHLDMNSGHCGFEFFRPYSPTPDPRDPALPTVARVDHDSQYDGEFPGVPSMQIRARKAVDSMQMRFPRYTQRDPRDFFYLTLRPVLPGPALSDGTALSSESLPHGGWPYAFARARHQSAWVVRIDPTRAVPAPIALGAPRHVRPLGRIARSAGGSHTLLATRLPIGWHFAVETVGTSGTELMRGNLASAASQAAMGVDRDGFLVYAEGQGARAALESAGVTTAIELAPQALAFETDEGGAGVGGEPRTVTDAMELFAEEQGRTEVLYPDNTPMPYNRWSMLQGQRVRYFPTQAPRFVRPE